MGTESAARPGAAAGEKPTDAIAALLQERRRYEQWLATLESRRAITPANVYERVHADYAGRLGAVLEQLAGRSADLQQTVAALTARVAALQADEAARRDERYEAELRAAVGEYTAERWTELSDMADADLARLGAERTELTAELAQVRQLLSMASARRPDVAAAAPSARSPLLEPETPYVDLSSTPPGLPPLAPPPPSTIPGGRTSAARPAEPRTEPKATESKTAEPKTVEPKLAETKAADAGVADAKPQSPRPGEPRTADGALRRAAPAASGPERSAPPATGAPPRAAASARSAPGASGELSMFDELEFLKSVVDPRTDQKGGPVAGRAPADRGSVDAPPELVLDAGAAPGNAPVDLPVTASAPAAKAPADRESAASLSAAAVGTKGRHPTPPEAGPLNALTPPGDRVRPREGATTDSVPIYLRDVPTEQVKSLKCQECGSMNYPTEWYCERCGGELAAM